MRRTKRNVVSSRLMRRLKGLSVYTYFLGLTANGLRCLLRYRYDGLYIVDRAYMKDNPSGKFKVCAFDFRVSISLGALAIKYT